MEWNLGCPCSIVAELDGCLLGLKNPSDAIIAIHYSPDTGLSYAEIDNYLLLTRDRLLEIVDGSWQLTLPAYSVLNVPFFPSPSEETVRYLQNVCDAFRHIGIEDTPRIIKDKQILE